MNRMRSHDTVDVTRVVAEEDTTKRGEGAHEVGLDGHWRLDDALVVRGRLKRFDVSSHCEGVGRVERVGRERWGCAAPGLEGRTRRVSTRE